MFWRTPVCRLTLVRAPVVAAANVPANLQQNVVHRMSTCQGCRGWSPGFAWLRTSAAAAAWPACHRVCLHAACKAQVRKSTAMGVQCHPCRSTNAPAAVVPVGTQVNMAGRRLICLHGLRNNTHHYVCFTAAIGAEAWPAEDPVLVVARRAHALAPSDSIVWLHAFQARGGVCVVHHTSRNALRF